MTVQWQVYSCAEARAAQRHCRALGCVVMFLAHGVWEGEATLFATGDRVEIPARGEGVVYEGERHTWTASSQLYVAAESARWRVR